MRERGNETLPTTVRKWIGATCFVLARGNMSAGRRKARRRRKQRRNPPDPRKRRRKPPLSRLRTNRQRARPRPGRHPRRRLAKMSFYNKSRSLLPRRSRYVRSTIHLHYLSDGLMLTCVSFAFINASMARTDASSPCGARKQADVGVDAKCSLKRQGEQQEDRRQSFAVRTQTSGGS